MTPSPLSYGPFISRQDSLRRGIKRYYTGKPCKHGHIDSRFTADRKCCTCTRIRLEKHLASPQRQEYLQSYYLDLAHKQERRDYMKDYLSSERGRKARRNYLASRKERSPEFRLLHTLRNRLRHALVGHAPRAASTLAMLGCSVEYLRQWLEVQFEPGMSWDNYGKDGWHVDHIRPCVSFNLADPAQQQECFHYSNLQPLWAVDNLSKSDKWQVD